MTPAVLGIDTSGNDCSVALVHDDVVVDRRREVGSLHAEHVLAMVRAVLDEAARPLGACAAIAYAAGPGSFTGLRVGCSVAQGLAFGAGLPVAPIGTLDAIAHAVDAREGTDLLVAQDARMGEVYWRRYVRDATGWAALGPAGLAVATQLRALIAGSVEMGAGNAWTIHRDAVAGIATTVAPVLAVDAVDVARLGVRAEREGRLVAADRADLIYVRDRVALTTAERADRRAASASKASVSA